MNKWGSLSRLIQRYFASKSQSQLTTLMTPQATHKQSHINTLQAKLNTLFSDSKMVNTCQKKERNESSS